MDRINFGDIYPFWADLTESEQERFAAATAVRKYSKGELVYQPDVRCEGMIYMLEGKLRVYILSDDGREITLYRLGPGEQCVFSASCVIEALSYEVFIEAETDARLQLTDAATLRLISEDNLFLRTFNQEIALMRASDILWTLQQVLFYSVDRRLAVYLLESSAKSGGRAVRGTHEQIAASIGSAREVVSRMLKRFADDGYIKLSRGMVEIIDKSSLEEVAGL